MAKKAKIVPDELDVGLAAKSIAQAMKFEAKKSGVSLDSLDKIEFIANLLSSSKFKFAGGDENAEEFNWNDGKAKANLMKRIDKDLDIKTAAAAEPSNKKNIAAPEAGDSLYSLNPTKINKQKQVIACKNALDDRSITILNNNKIGVGIIDCLGRLTAETMFDLCNKSKQVILVACTGEECHFASGSNKTEAIVFLVNKILSQLGNEQRIELIKTSKIENVINSYSIEKIIGGEKTSAKII